MDAQFARPPLREVGRGEEHRQVIEANEKDVDDDAGEDEQRDEGREEDARELELAALFLFRLFCHAPPPKNARPVAGRADVALIDPGARGAAKGVAYLPTARAYAP